MSNSYLLNGGRASFCGDAAAREALTARATVRNGACCVPAAESEPAVGETKNAGALEQMDL